MLRYLAGPVIGAIIGYFTNYIAVKMLFYPRKEVYLFGHKLPLTPGAIPKGKGRLAKAIGEVVGSTLITKEDLEEKLLSDAVQDQMSDAMMDALRQPLREEVTVLTGCSDESYEEAKSKVARQISKAAIRCASKLDLASIIVEKGGAVIREKTAGTMLAMFLSDDLINSIAGPVGVELERMLQEDGEETLIPIVLEEITELEVNTTTDILAGVGVQEEVLRATLKKVICDLIRKGMGNVLASVDLAGIVREKVDRMSVDELEEMVLTVMKKELNTIVNLGALIGLILGTLNIWL